MKRTGGEMPDEGSLRQIHEEIQVVAELLEETVAQIAVERHSEQLADLRELHTGITALYHLLLNTVGYQTFARAVNEWHHSVIILFEQRADHVCY